MMKSRGGLIVLCAILVLGSLQGCWIGGSGDYHLVTYTNEDYGYAIEYPSNWSVEVSDDGKGTSIRAPAPYWGMVSVHVLEDTNAPSSAVAQGLLQTYAELFEEFVVSESRATTGTWDWQTCYAGVFGGSQVSGVGYYKEAQAHLYGVEAVAEEPTWDAYPLDEIISTFRLLPVEGRGGQFEGYTQRFYHLQE